jgi:hypothetical protein
MVLHDIEMKKAGLAEMNGDIKKLNSNRIGANRVEICEIGGVARIL